MEDFEREHRPRNSSAYIVGLIIFAFLCWWVYQNYLQPVDEPWWSGTKEQRACVVHDPNDSSCYTIPVTANDGRITSMVLPDGKVAIIAINDCDKAETDFGLAGKGKRYCVVGELGGGREWQVSER